MYSFDDIISCFCIGFVIGGTFVYAFTKHVNEILKK